MSWQPDEQLLEQLLALVDGELPPQERPALLAYLAEHPQAARWLAEQSAVTALVRRELTEHAEAAPAQLKARIRQIKPPRRIAPVHLNWLTAVAASFLLCWLIFRGNTPSPSIPAATGSVIPANIIAHASRVHDDCSRAIEASEQLHARPFPADRGPLATHIEHDLHSDRPVPDFSTLGFHFVGAGPCGDPVPRAVHLLYHSNRPHSDQTISVFAQPFDGQYPLELSRVYTVSVPQSPFPMLAWRSESVVYFLLADDEPTEQAALSLIHH